MRELEKIIPSLSDNEYIRDDSLTFWYSLFLESQVVTMTKGQTLLLMNFVQINITFNSTEETFMKKVGNFLIEHTDFLQDIKMNVSYTDQNLSSILMNGDFQITVECSYPNVMFKHSFRLAERHSSTKLWITRPSGTKPWTR